MNFALLLALFVGASAQAAGTCWIKEVKYASNRPSRGAAQIVTVTTTESDSWESCDASAEKLFKVVTKGPARLRVSRHGKTGVRGHYFDVDQARIVTWKVVVKFRDETGAKKAKARYVLPASQWMVDPALAAPAEGDVKEVTLPANTAPSDPVFHGCE